MQILPYSVLMSVYGREASDCLDGALDSVYRQSVPPSEVILVKDGPLTAELENVIERYRRRYANRLVLVPLESNVGLGLALSSGLERCTSELIARMDTDDICDSDRCEKQLQFLSANPQIAVVGTWIAEFESDKNRICSERRLPTRPDELLRFARTRNPLNHMTVMFRKNAVVEAGGYQPFEGFEDYFLWVRLLLRGGLIANIPEPLVRVRAGSAQLARRGGLRYAMIELRFQRMLFKTGFISFPLLAFNCAVRSLARVLPVTLRALAYRLLRQSA